MQYGDPIYLACPHCKEIIELPTIESGNTFGAVRWSDGYYHTPMLPWRSPVNICPNCSEPFWLPDAPKIEPNSPRLKGGKDREFKYLHWQSDLDGWHKIVERGIAKEEDHKIHIRIRAWWAFNDAVRNQDGGSPLGEWDRANLSTLLALLEPKGEHLLRAAIHRQTGGFEECLELLVGVKGDSKFARLRAYDASAIHAHATQGDACVFELADELDE